jgi:hypothetical protein
MKLWQAILRDEDVTHYRSGLLKLVFLALITGLLAACGGGNDENRVLPTIITIPPTTPTVEGAASARPTLPPSWTPAASETPTEAATRRPGDPTSTITPTPSWTPTPTITETIEASALDGLIELALRFTPLPPEFQVLPEITPTPTVVGFGIGQPSQPLTPTSLALATSPTTTGSQCTYLPPLGFGQVFTDPAIAAALGCPLGQPPTPMTLNSASQTFENGAMLWLDEAPGYIYVLFGDGTYQRYTDTFDAAVDPISGGAQPPAGRFEPVRGFGKVWREQPGVRDRLGWAINNESGGPAVTLSFVSGRMVSSDARGDILVLTTTGTGDNGRWQAVPGRYQ